VSTVPSATPFGVLESGIQTIAFVRSSCSFFIGMSSLYVRNVSASQRGSATLANVEPVIDLGLPTGSRLRARLESAASTAVRTPVLAVIEYNYECEGEIIVPAGAKAVGHIQQADRSGYMTIQFDSLMMPDGAALPIEGVATNLSLGPPKGKVEGKNTGKNVLVRSLSGIGEVGAMLVGRGNLDQPLECGSAAAQPSLPRL
jgi:hypothetical protein